MTATTNSPPSYDDLNRIKWRIFYKDKEGTLVGKSRYRLSKPDIAPDPEEDVDKDEEGYLI